MNPIGNVRYAVTPKRASDRRRTLEAVGKRHKKAPIKGIGSAGRTNVILTGEITASTAVSIFSRDITRASPEISLVRTPLERSADLSPYREYAWQNC